MNIKRRGLKKMKKLILIAVGITILCLSPAWGYETLIDAQTAAVTTAFVSKKGIGDITLAAHGLSESEEIELQIEYAPGLYTDVYSSSGVQTVLSSTQNIIVVDIYGRYRLVKPITSSAVTVVKYSEATP